MLHLNLNIMASLSRLNCNKVYPIDKIGDRPINYLMIFSNHIDVLLLVNESVAPAENY